MNRFFVLFIALMWSFSAAWPQKNNVANLSLCPDEVLRGHFVQERNMKGFDRPLKSEGSFVISPTHGLIWNVTKPFPTVTVITSEGLAQNSNGTMTVNLSSQKMPFVSQLYEMIAGVLTGKWDALQKKFIIEQSGKADQWQMKLTPRKTDDHLMPFREIKVKGGQFVHEVIMIKPDGDSDVLSFDSVSLTQSSLSADEISTFGLVSP